MRPGSHWHGFSCHPMSPCCFSVLLSVSEAHLPMVSEKPELFVDRFVWETLGFGHFRSENVNIIIQLLSQSGIFNHGLPHYLCGLSCNPIGGLATPAKAPLQNMLFLVVHPSPQRCAFVSIVLPVRPRSNAHIPQIVLVRLIMFRHLLRCDEILLCFLMVPHHVVDSAQVVPESA